MTGNNEVFEPYEMLAFVSWEKMKGESSLAYSAFCTYRDFGPDRNIKKAVLGVEPDGAKAGRKYRTWRNWSTCFHWVRRAEDYDKFLDKLRLTERRKMIEGREEVHRQITGKMLDVVNKKLDMMGPEDLTQGNVTDWVKTAIQAEREVLGMGREEDEGKQGDYGQLEIKFDADFEGL